MTGVLILLAVVGLTLGPIGHNALSHPATPNLLIVFLWAVAWFRNRDEALRLALGGGILLDLAGSSYFGLWTASAVAVVLLIEALKLRFLETASLLHSLVALAVASLVPLLLTALLTKNFYYPEILLAVLGNVMIGFVVYYLLAMRFKLFQRWAGRRIG